ncbi:MAG: hypothetical protein IJ456_08735 [Bacteroides sp.]|nr:hypothetical protein [Bacteroides sp.]
MNRITVIADDITGAAEMAGIGYRYGLTTALLTDILHPLPDVELLVIATDTRSMNQEEAVNETRRILREWKKEGSGRLFKKTDSALRGHISAELRAILEETDYRQVALLPQNPSRNRVVKEGVYLVDDIPLHKTAFAYDPEFPAHTSNVSDIVPSFHVIDASCPIQVKEAAAVIDDHTLPAGAADFFSACLLHWGFKEKKAETFQGLSALKTLIVCGSTQSTALDSCGYIRRNQIPSIGLSAQTFYTGQPEKEWIRQLGERYQQANGLVLTTAGYPPQEGKAFAVRLRETMARILNILLQQELPNELIIEGGATAFAILRELSWNRFRLTDEITPGIVRMRCLDFPKVHVTLKPGSYPWGSLFDD